METHGERVELDTLLSAIGVPDELCEAVAYLVSCPNCGKQGFVRYDWVARPVKYYASGGHTLSEVA